MGPCHPPHPMLCPGGEQVAGRWPPAASHTRALGISRGEEAEVPSPAPALPDVPLFQGPLCFENAVCHIPEGRSPAFPGSLPPHIVKCCGHGKLG